MKGSFIKGAFVVAMLVGAPACIDGLDVEDQGDLSQSTEEVGDDIANVDPDDSSLATESSSAVSESGIDTTESVISRESPTFAFGTTSSAASCPANFFCLWEHTNFSGRMLIFQGSGCQNLGPYGFNDKMSSWFNRRGANYRVYWDANCRGAKFTAGNGSRSESVGGWNDQASSICRGVGCP